MHTERAHARLSPSGSKRWMNCPGSVALEGKYPDESSVYAAEGTAAHEAAEVCLRGGFAPSDMVGRMFGKCEAFPAGFECTAEMADAVDVYVQWVRDTVKRADGKSNEYLLEERVEIDCIGTYGTADIVVYDATEKTLIVGDLKYGRGVAVEAWENTQGLLYAIGALKRFHNRPVETVRVVIVQPRCPHPDGPIRSWELPYAEIIDWKLGFMDAAEAVAAGDASLKPGEWCKFCKAAPECPALRSRAHEIAMADFDAFGSVVVSAPETLTDERLAKVLGEAEVLAIWCKRVEEHAMSKAKAGVRLPGYKLVATRATRRWKDEHEAKATLSAQQGVDVNDLFTEPELKSVAQMEKVFGKKNFSKLAADLVESKSAGITLAPENDKRPAISPDAADEFSEGGDDE